MPLPNNRTITITGHPDYPPVIWQSPNKGAFQGIAVELMQMILAEADIKVQFVNSDTWARAQEQVKNGKVDMLLPPYKTPERLPYYNYSEAPFIMDELGVFVKKGNEFPFEKLEDLIRYSGTAIINDSLGVELDQLYKVSNNMTRMPTTEQCFRFVDKGRARYVVTGLSAGMLILNQLNWENRYVMLPKVIGATGMYAPISRRSAWNIPELNEFLSKKFVEYTKNGTIKRLQKKYLALLRQEYKANKIILNKSTKPGDGAS